MNSSNYRHHRYEWSKPFGSVRHSWELIGAKGGIHFHVSLFQDQPSCGLEIHRFSPPEYAPKEPPSQMPCWLLKGPCWHDGTSLYATETLWPRIEGYLRAGDHERIFNILEQEADSRFYCEAKYE